MFDLNEFINAESNTHQFTTDNVYLNQVGLGTFTTGTLYAYFNARGRDGDYINRDVIRRPREGFEETGAYINDMGDFLNVDEENPSGAYVWEGWRKSEYTGTWTRQPYDRWELIETGMTSAYNWGQIEPIFDLFEINQSLDFNNIELATCPKKAVNAETGFVVDGVPLKVQKDSRDDAVKAAIDHSFLYGTPLINIINMNDFMIDLKRQKPRSQWKDLFEWEFNKTNLFAMDEFLSDIKSSKGHAIKCSGELIFNLQMAEGRFQCPKREWVTFYLSLFDSPPRKSPKAKAVLKDLNMAFIKRDATGRKYLDRTDGDSTPADDNNPAHKTVAEMKLSYNPYLNKWESGTASIIAKVVTPIARSVFNPAITVLENADIAANLADGSEELHFAPSSGLVMPIQMQNGNPFQYSPNYAKTADCRAEDKTKQKLTAFNFNPKKSFKVDDMVMCSQIDGIWHTISLDEDLEEEEAVETQLAGQWEFTQFITNWDFYFRDSRTGDQVDPEVVERSFHKMYYGDDLKNGAVPSRVPTDAAGRMYPDGFSTSGVPLIYIDNGYCQVDSFDFMDEQLFGFREKNALAATLGTRDAAGRSFDNEEGELRSDYTGFFFGCVFPDGYTSDSIASAGKSKNWNIKHQNSGALFPSKRGEYNATYNEVTDDEGKITKSYINGLPIFQDMGFYSFGGNALPGIVNSGIDPFEEDQGISRDQNGKISVYKPVRSDVERVRTVFPDAEFPEDEAFDTPHKYGRGEYDPSMFYEYNLGTNKSLEHLPADIALNASPTSDYGAPLYNLHRLDKFAEQGFYNADLRLEVKKAFNNAAWLVKQSGDYKPEEHDPTASAFGFKPTKPNSIMFRPLKTELAWAFNNSLGTIPIPQDLVATDIENKGYFPDVIVQRNGDGQLVSFSPDTDINEGIHACHAFGLMVSNRNPMDFYTINPADDQNNQWNESNKAQLSQQTLQAESRDIGPLFVESTWDFGNERRLDGKRIGFGKYLEQYPQYGGRLHDQYFHDDSEWRWLQGGTGHGMIGVIGATTTVAVNSEINFNTIQKFGMKSHTYSKLVGAGNVISLPIGGLLGLVGAVRAAGTLTIYQRPSWGGAPDKNHDDENTTCLSVTIYHAHPRTQTIYDPRYFCVHHFNELPDLEGVYTNPAAWYTRYLEDNNGRQLQTTDTATLLNNTGDEYSFTYHVDPTENKIGIREPSIYSGEENTLPVPLAENAIIMKNGFKQNDEYIQLLPTANRHLNCTRFGKLLPYEYRYFTVGGPHASGENVDVQLLTPRPDGSDYGSAEDFQYLVAATNLGSNSQVGDIVGNLNNNVLYSVQQVRLNDEKEVTFMSLQCISEGDNLQESLFSNVDDRISNTYTGGLRLRNVAGIGNGFDGFVVNGRVHVKKGVDSKPKAIAREQRLSLPPDNTAASEVAGGTNPSFGKVQGENLSTFGISSEDRSPDRKYDCFFHFHNDTSFTWACGGGQGRSGSRAGMSDGGLNDRDTFEQYIQLDITGS